MKAISLMILLSSFICGTGHSAESCKIYPAAINESYQIMLGRNATTEEACHYANVVKNGVQIAYYEPYYFPIPGAVAPMKCGWQSFTYDPNMVGIASYNSTEWSLRFGDLGHYATAVYKTLLGKSPSWNSKNPGDLSNKETLGYWVKILSGIAAGYVKGTSPTPLQQLSTQIQATFPDRIKLNPELIQYMFRKHLNREPNLRGCDLGMSPAPDSGSDCYFLYSLAKGSMSVDDIIHAVRSTQEYVTRNLEPSCYQQIFPDGVPPAVAAGTPLYDQHGFGEYISQIYRIFLNRYPSQEELETAFKNYAGGDTQAVLKAIAERIINR
jgi:hypothetical protein